MGDPPLLCRFKPDYLVGMEMDAVVIGAWCAPRACKRSRLPALVHSLPPKYGLPWRMCRLGSGGMRSSRTGGRPHVLLSPALPSLLVVGPRGGKGGRGDLYTQYLLALAEPPEGDAPVRRWISFCRVSGAGEAMSTAGGWGAW